jgi:hypothetical protein
LPSNGPSKWDQLGLVWFLGWFDIIAIPENDVGVAALVLVIPPDVGPFVGVMERYHVITNQDFKLANWNGLPALGIAEKVVGGEKF